jgi:lipopolysaccharide/colanic/teichoic acid biosynthesis glycosyltransferase
MRNTQPLLAGSPLGGRVEWKGAALSRATNFVPHPNVGGFWERFHEIAGGLALWRRGGLHSSAKATAPLKATKPISGSASQPLREARVFSSVAFQARPAFPTWKRVLDLGLVIATLPVWLGVMILVTLWIKLASPGPTFYKQERVGHRGRRFMILKFRSMRVNAETVSHEQYFQNLIKANTPMAKLDAAGDPRLIPGGRMIRALGIDELPQLLNVLRGDMSLVGPRPCTPKEFEHYEFWHQERVKAPPGLTGFWQVNGKNRTTFTEMIAMDIFYAEHMSLCLDLEIILKTGTAIGAQALEANLKPRFGFLVGKP